MKKVIICCVWLFVPWLLSAQQSVDFSKFNRHGDAKATTVGDLLTINWPINQTEQGRIVMNLKKDVPLFQSLGIGSAKKYHEIASYLNPAFVLTVGKRDLVSQNGWNIFFDKVPQKPHQSHPIKVDKGQTSIISDGTHTIVRMHGLSAETFKGYLELTLYHASSLVNIAAVMATEKDSTAILYDAGLLSKTPAWKSLTWANTDNTLHTEAVNETSESKNVPVKYRTIIGEGKQGSLAVFPAPHQYFYPLDEAFNLKFVWHGNNYFNGLLTGYGIGIRQDLEGDHRYVPWFNAPPRTEQRLNFYCLLSKDTPANVLSEVKKYTHDDVYKPLAGYKTMVSHFHNEFVMNVVLAGKPVPENPTFVQVFKNTGINIVHLAEFHYTAHPKGPDEQRLTELKTLFDQCKRLSDRDFLLLPGEEPNEFLGGHWLDFFPKPVYWIMARKPDQPFVTEDPRYGKVYRIANKSEMLRLLEEEKGLAWTAHARTKGSTGFPDKYNQEPFFLSDRFMGAAWKAIPADLSQPRLGKRALDLLDDMNNWGLKKTMIGEADLFTIEPENEMYAHLNVNYLQLDKLPDYNQDWQPILTTMQRGKFFTTTGEVLLPSFTVNNIGSGGNVSLEKNGEATIALKANWTFPLNFAEIISGDGNQVYRERIDLHTTKQFGNQEFKFKTKLKGRKWVRIELWDVAANGAFTQSVYIE